jgi:hypothetical protein
MSRDHEPGEHFDPQRSSDAREAGHNESVKAEEAREHAPDHGSPVTGRALHRTAPRAAEPRTVYELRGRTYRLRNSEIATMVELGKFRVVAKEDLAEFAYGGDNDRMRPDVENLFRQGLAEMKSIPHEESGSRQLLTLTKNGHRLLKETRVAGKQQALYHGFTKPREAHHDADLYRLYQKEAEKIERQGGRNLRVVLDYELKKHLYHDLAKLGKDRNSADNKRAIAERHGLQVVRGKIPVPDVRIEYETRDGEKARVDLELATGHYRGRTLAEKVRAGFSIYAHAGEASKLRRILDQRELTAEIPRRSCPYEDARGQVGRIAALGYTETEARFLYIVATHSGYFTLRQFLAFTGAHRGRRSTAFAQKLLKHAHATIRDYMGTGSVFHLFSRLIYRPIEKDNLRNRRRHSFEYIRTRLVLLDFLLQNPAYEFLETEEDKVCFFCESLGVPKDALPAKVYEGGPESRPTLRYFVDKFPLFLASPISGASPVTFTYVDSGCASLSNFVAHLGAYQALFRQLKSFRLLYVAARTTQFGCAETRFRNFIKQLNGA